MKLTQAQHEIAQLTGRILDLRKREATISAELSGLRSTRAGHLADGEGDMAAKLGKRIAALTSEHEDTKAALDVLEQRHATAVANLKDIALSDAVSMLRGYLSEQAELFAKDDPTDAERQRCAELRLMALDLGSFLRSAGLEGKLDLDGRNTVRHACGLSWRAALAGAGREATMLHFPPPDYPKPFAEIQKLLAA